MAKQFEVKLDSNAIRQLLRSPQMQGIVKSANITGNIKVGTSRAVNFGKSYKGKNKRREDYIKKGIAKKYYEG